MSNEAKLHLAKLAVADHDLIRVSSWVRSFCFVFVSFCLFSILSFFRKRDRLILSIFQLCCVMSKTFFRGRSKCCMFVGVIMPPNADLKAEGALSLLVEKERE